MKLILKLAVTALFAGVLAHGVTTAGAQPAPTPTEPTQGSSSAQPAPPVAPMIKEGTGSGSDATAGTPAAPGSGAGMTAAAGSAATKPTAGDPAAGAGSAAGSAAAPQGEPWFDQLADKPVDEEGTFFLPRAVNSVARDSDMMFYTVLGLSAFFFFAIAAAVVYFVIKYRHRPGHKPEPSAGHNDALEVTWTVIPTLICVFLFYYGWRTYVKVVTPPQKAVEIQVLASRWAWQFTHANGVTDSDLHVPVNTAVRLVMTSTDVLHSFYSPVMRVKQDIIPRRYTYAWFIADRPGTYRLTCAEYCGKDHSQMSRHGEKSDGRRAVVVVHAAGEYEQYLADKDALSNKGPLDQVGRKLYESKGCVACHALDGSIKVGPSFLHDFGTKFKLASGADQEMNEDYIRESLMSPSAKAKPGFPVGQMPSFEGRLKEREIQAIIAFIKSLQ